MSGSGDDSHPEYADLLAPEPSVAEVVPTPQPQVVKKRVELHSWGALAALDEANAEFKPVDPGLLSAGVEYDEASRAEEALLADPNEIADDSWAPVGFDQSEPPPVKADEWTDEEVTGWGTPNPQMGGHSELPLDAPFESTEQSSPDRVVDMPGESAEFAWAPTSVGPGEMAKRPAVKSGMSMLEALSLEPVDLDAVKPSTTQSPKGAEVSILAADPTAPPDRHPTPIMSLPREPSRIKRVVPFKSSDLLRNGLNFLGAIPSFAPRDRSDAFPEGSLPTLKRIDPKGPPIVARLPALPEPGTERSLARRLLDRLQAEIASSVDRQQLALLFHGMGVLAMIDEDPSTGGAGFAKAAFTAANQNDPNFELNQWSYDALRAPGEVIARLTRRSKSADAALAMHQAGHVAVRMGDSAKAARLWAQAGEGTPEALAALLARMRTHLMEHNPEAADAVIEAAFGAVEGDLLWGALTLRRLSRSEITGGPDALDMEFEGLFETLGASAALAAAAEHHALRHGRTHLLLRALKVRHTHLMSAYQSGEVDEVQSQLALGEVSLKAAWALEGLGEHKAALSEFEKALETIPADPFVLLQALDLARRSEDIERQEVLLTQWAQLSPVATEQANAHYQVGLLRERADDLESAIAAFERATTADPTFAPALAALGRHFAQSGRWASIKARSIDEIEALEARHGAAEGEIRAEIEQRLVQMYYRMARLLADELGESALSIDYDKRALSLNPSFMPAFLAVEHAFERNGRWRELVALYVSYAGRCTDEIERVQILRAAADYTRIYLGDDANAGRLYARSLAIEPDDSYTLRRASECFGRLGVHTARVEVQQRWGRADPRAARRLLRAAELKSLIAEGDHEADTLQLFKEAFDRLPDEAAAIDGFVRAAVLAGDMEALLQQVDRHDLAAVESSVLFILLVESLLACDEPQAAASLLYRWRADRRADGRLSGTLDDSVLSLLSIAQERSADWAGLVETLQARSSRGTDACRAVLNARIGELREFRLDEREDALKAYQTALELKTDCQAALEGLSRLSPRKSGGANGLFDAAWRAQRDGDRAGRKAALDARIAETQDPEEVLALQLVADVRAVDADTHLNRFLGRPERRDLFDVCIETLQKQARGRDVIAAMWARLPHERGGCRQALLGRLVGRCLATNELDGARRAAEAILETDPDSLPATLALLRISRLTGTQTDSLIETLGRSLQAPGPAAEALVRSALVAKGRGDSEAEVGERLHQAVSLDPRNAAASETLANHLADSGDWEALQGHYARWLGYLAPGPLRSQAVRRRAELQADCLDDPRGALQGLLTELDLGPVTLETTLQAAQLAERLEEREITDAQFARAIEVCGETRRAEIELAYAQILSARGTDLEAAQILSRVLEVNPSREAWELAAEVRGRLKDWGGVIDALKALMGLETDRAQKADRAMAIGEVYARVKQDPRRASGWFKRAVELEPSRLRATWRMLAEIDQLPQGAVPMEHITDAMDRALGALRVKLAEEPIGTDVLRNLARLYHRRGEQDGCRLACAVLVYLGVANEIEERLFEEGQRGTPRPFSRPMTAEMRTDGLTHSGEVCDAHEVFNVCAKVLCEATADRMPAAAARMSRRSFATWQAGFRQLATSFGVEDVELWKVGDATEFTALYLPQGAVAAPDQYLGSSIDARQSYALGFILEGVRGGRLLFERDGVQVAQCVAALCANAAPNLITLDESLPELPEALATRLANRAHRLPHMVRTQLEAFAADKWHLTSEDFISLGAGVRRTRQRAGWLCSGSLQLTLDQVLFPDAAAAEAATVEDRARALAHSIDATALLNYALGPAALKLRRLLGISV